MNALTILEAYKHAERMKYLYAQRRGTFGIANSDDALARAWQRADRQALAFERRLRLLLAGIGTSESDVSAATTEEECWNGSGLSFDGCKPAARKAKRCPNAWVSYHIWTYDDDHDSDTCNCGMAFLSPVTHKMTRAAGLPLHLVIKWHLAHGIYIAYQTARKIFSLARRAE